MQDGNEYLPASLRLRVDAQTSPVPTNTGTLTANAAIETSRWTQAVTEWAEVPANDQGGIVPALTTDTLAGVSVNEPFLNHIRIGLEAMGKTNWLAVTSHLLTTDYFTELTKAVALLNTERVCCCQSADCRYWELPLNLSFDLPAGCEPVP